MPVRVTVFPFTMVVADMTELLTSSSAAVTVTSKNFLTISPLASLTFTHTSYSVAFAGFISTEVFCVKFCLVVHFV